MIRTVGDDGPYIRKKHPVTGHRMLLFIYSWLRFFIRLRIRSA